MNPATRSVRERRQESRPGQRAHSSFINGAGPPAKLRKTSPLELNLNQSTKSRPPQEQASVVGDASRCATLVARADADRIAALT
jgi:hypothetical protein